MRWTDALRKGMEVVTAVRGVPDPGALVTAEEIEVATGAKPVGEPRTNGAGSDGDVGRMRIWESGLANGDKFLVTLLACHDRGSAELAMKRMGEESAAKPSAGLGERGLVRVKRYRKTGKSEVGVTALQGRMALSLTHTSAEGRTDPEPLAELLRHALTRL